jgi:hypothetical protein
LPLDIDLDSLSLAWAVFGGDWDTSSVARDGICVLARNFKGCELVKNQTERAKAIETALSLDDLTGDPEKLSLLAAAVLQPGLVEAGSLDADVVKERVLDSLNAGAGSHMQASSAVARAAALLALFGEGGSLEDATAPAPAPVAGASIVDTVGMNAAFLERKEVEALAATVAVDLVSMQEPSYAQGLAALALAAADSRKGHLIDPAAVEVTTGDAALLSTKPGETGLSAVLLSAGAATGGEVSVLAGDGTASVAVQAALDGVSRSSIAENAGLVVFMALRGLEAKAGVATGPVLSEARVADTLIVTIQACCHAVKYRLSTCTKRICTRGISGVHYCSVHRKELRL